MSRMKLYRIALFGCFMLLPCWLFSQVKVVEKSKKEKPAWVDGVERNYLIVSATGNNIEEAKEKILLSLKQQIVHSIAEKITSETSAVKSQTDVNGKKNVSAEYKSAVYAKAAHIPYVNEIALSKASDFYWEKLYNKKEKVYTYSYHVKYLFSEFEIAELVAAFNAHEEELNRKIKEYAEGVEQVTSIPEIGRAIGELTALSKEFEAEDPRIAQIDQVKNNYRSLYNSILVEGQLEAKELLVFSLTLNGKNVTPSEAPQVKSNCASNIELSFAGDKWKVKFDDFGCYEDDENYIEIRYRFGSRPVSKKFILNQN